MSCYSLICETNNKYMKNYLKYGDVNSFYVWAMSQKLHVNDFKWLKETSQFNENVIKVHNEDSGIGYFIETDVQYPEKLHELNNDLLFLPERVKKTCSQLA